MRNESYGGEEFAEVVRAVLALADRLGPELSAVERALAVTSPPRVGYEWMFWDMGYRREGWPIHAEPPRAAKQ